MNFLVGKDLSGRRNPLLPQSTENLPDLSEQRKKRQLAPKALSVAISPSELEGALAEGATMFSAPFSQHSFNHDIRHSE
jgi:hypothetical protein